MHRRLHLLGIPSLADGSGIRTLGDKPLVLLTRLLIDGRPLDRHAAVAFLWPESPEARARGSLRQALHAIRAIMGAKCISATRRQIALTDPPATDVTDFLAAARTGDHVAAVRCYSGPLLQGVTVAHSHEAELWLELKRTLLDRLFEAAGTSILREQPGCLPAADEAQLARNLRDLSPRSPARWSLLLDTLRRVGATDDLHMEIATLEARIATGQIDDTAAAMLLVSGVTLPMQALPGAPVSPVIEVVSRTHPIPEQQQPHAPQQEALRATSVPRQPESPQR
jgi:two-component SAPR family response regulator